MGHSALTIEYIAESRSSAASPVACDGCQLRSTPSNVAPSASIAVRDRVFRRVGLEVDPLHRPRLERIRQEQQLRRNVDAGPLRRRREPGATDLDGERERATGPRPQVEVPGRTDHPFVVGAHLRERDVGARLPRRDEGLHIVRDIVGRGRHRGQTEAGPVFGGGGDEPVDVRSAEWFQAHERVPQRRYVGCAGHARRSVRSAARSVPRDSGAEVDARAPVGGEGVLRARPR